MNIQPTVSSALLCWRGQDTDLNYDLSHWNYLETLQSCCVVQRAMVEVSSDSTHWGQTVSSEEEAQRISLLKQLRLGLSSTYYSMAQVLGLRRLQDYMQVADRVQADESRSKLTALMP